MHRARRVLLPSEVMDRFSQDLDVASMARAEIEDLPGTQLVAPVLGQLHRATGGRLNRVLAWHDSFKSYQ